MTQSRSSRHARPFLAVALLSASALATAAGTFITSRAGIEYAPTTSAIEAPPSTGPAATARQSSLGNEAVDARGDEDYAPNRISASAIAGDIERLSSALLGGQAGDAGAGRDRAGVSYTPARYDSVEAWLASFGVDRENQAVTLAPPASVLRTGNDFDPATQ